MKLEIRSASSLSAAERFYIEDRALKIFGAQDQGLEWAQGDWFVLIWEGEELASQVEIVDRIALVGGKPLRLGGIGGVATWPAWRRRGLAALAVQKAMEFIRAELGVEFGLLICDAEKLPFYARMGWQEAGASLLIDQPGGKIVFQTPVMVWPCQEKEWPEGEIDLCGRPW